MMDPVRMRELFVYEPATGLFRYRIDVRGGRNSAFLKAKAGELAGGIGGAGYWCLSAGGRRVGAHRVAWLLMTGDWPVSDIDHVNGVRTDNRWSNLRLATRSENMQNLKAPHKDNETGFLGVERKRDRFAARISIEGKRMYLGVFTTPQEAHVAYINAKRRLHERNTL